MKYAEIIQTLRDRRTELNITHSELEKATGIPRPNLIRMLRTEGNITTSNLIKLSQALKLSIHIKKSKP